MTVRDGYGLLASAAFLVACVSSVWPVGEPIEAVRRAVMAVFFVGMAGYFVLRMIELNTRPKKDE